MCHRSLALRLRLLNIHFLGRFPRSSRFAERCANPTKRFKSSVRQLDHSTEEPKANLASGSSHASGRRISLLALLEERNLIHTIAGPRDGLERLLSSKSIGAYCGVDPTAQSIHIGNLLPLMVLFWLYLHGHRAFTLVGGATVKIGDPGWRTTARERKAESEQVRNSSSIQQQMTTLWERIDNVAKSSQDFNPYETLKREQLDNIDWLRDLTFIEIIGTLGRGLKLNALLAKDSMKTRMWAGKEMGHSAGLSLSELSYPALQSWDFWHLYQNRDIQLQVGGCDQYGNITTSVDAVQYMIHNYTAPDSRGKDFERSYGLTTPLITIGPGEKKMGKSSGNAIWLDPNLTSDFELYQYFTRLADADVERFWKMFTFRPIHQIEQAMKEHHQTPELRSAHHALAHDFLSLHRGERAASLARDQHARLFASRSASVLISEQRHTSLASPSEGTTSSSEPPMGTSNGLPSTPLVTSDTTAESADTPTSHSETTPAILDLPTTPYPAALTFQQPIIDILVDLNICQSKSEARRMLSAQGGLYHGPQFAPIRDMNMHFKPHSANSPDATSDGVPLAEGNLLILRRGKWKIKVMRVISDQEYGALGEDNWTAAWRARRCGKT